MSSSAIPEPSILLCGMRGAGKTTLASLVAHHLNLSPALDADLLFTAHTTLTPPLFVKQYGWPAFRQTETEILRQILARIRAGERLVVSLGGGVVEEEVNRSLLKEFWGENGDGIVIHVFREVEQVLSDGGRKAPEWKDATKDEVWLRRRPWFRECSSHEFVNFTNSPAPVAQGEDDQTDELTKRRIHRMQFEQVERDFIRFFRRILPPYSPSPPLRPFTTPGPSQSRSYLVTLPFPSLHSQISSLPYLTTGASAIELRLDLLDPLTEDHISEQVGLLRRFTPGLPVLVSLRSVDQGGRWKGEGCERILKHAFKLGVEVVDLELEEGEVVKALVKEAKRRGTTVMISWRDLKSPAEGGFRWDGDEVKEKYWKAVELEADLVKIVGTASSVDDNFLLRVFAASVKNAGKQPAGGLSAYNMGKFGRMSRFLNPVLASVTHSIARVGTKGIVGAPSMTFKEVQMALHLSGLLDRKSFVLFGGAGGSGQRIKTFCEKGFEELGLPFELELWEGGRKEGLQWARDDLPFFAGGVLSVEDDEMIQMIEVIEQGAKDVGGVDAFVVGEEGRLTGDCIFAKTLLNIFEARLSPSNAISPSSFALVLSPSRLNLTPNLQMRAVFSALTKLGINQIAVADPAVDDLVELSKKIPGIIVCCDAGMEFREDAVRSLLRSPTGGVVVDLSPLAADSVNFSNSILERARDESHTRRGWITLTAEQVNADFARELFKFWTGTFPPKW